jgi:hypothetical protein
VLKRFWKDILVLAGMAIFVLVCFSGPVCDSDFWWQMKYGEYMLSHHTLIPDHTIYSWFPSDNATIYCAWISQLVMYACYKLGGLPAIYALRYLIFFLSILPFYLYARRESRAAFSAVFAVIATLCWILSPSMAVRPTLFSLPCLVSVLWIYFTVKRDQSRWKLFYVMPLIIVVWVNSHGLFVFGGVFLFLAFAGELLNAKFGRAGVLEKKTLIHFFAASALCAPAFFVSPYWYHYPVNLVIQVFANEEYMKWTNENVAEFVSLYTANPVLFIVSILSFAAAAFVTLRLWLAKKRDIAFLLLLVSTLGMALYYYRLNMVYGFTAAFILLYYIGQRPQDRPLSRRAAAAFLVYAAGLVVLIAPNMLYTPWTQGDLFSTDLRYQCAYEESEFVRQCGFKKVGNDHNIGSYMIWALGPDTKIMMDPRWFPYKEHLSEYTRLLQNPMELMLYFYKQNCDAWVISYPFGRQLSYFFYSMNDWKIGFYGQYGIVFVKKDYPVAAAAKRFGDFRNIHNIGAATSALMIACDFNDWEGAQEVLQSFDKNFSVSIFGVNIFFAHTYYEGRRALFEKDYETAAIKLEACGSGIPAGLMPYAAQMFALQEWEKGNDYKAYTWAMKAFSRDPKDPINLYNSGVLGWWVKRQILTGALKDAKVDDNWRDNIDRFLLADGSNPSTAEIRAQCAQIIDGSFSRKPQMLYPPVPRSLSFVAVDK